jgi:hypothetical protein
MQSANQTQIDTAVITEPEILGKVNQINDSCYIVVPKKLRKNQLPFVREDTSFTISQVIETDKYVDVVYRFKKPVKVTSL